MHITSVDPEGFPQIDTYITKQGSRREWKLSTEDSFVQSIVKQLAIHKPLRFASLMQALPTDGPSQTMHKDSNDSDRTNAIVYLTDVDADNGPIEFLSGPVVGPRGTTVVYQANEMHRGLANHGDKDRLALTMAFSDNDSTITTIGEVPPPDESWKWKLALAIAAAVLIYYFFFYKK
jgi:hypothetical protein